MCKFKISLCALVSVLFLIAVTPRIGMGQKSAPSPVPPPMNVKVVNTDAEPVPVTGTVSVSNLGSSPLPVRDVDNPARRAVQFQAFLNCSGGGIGCSPAQTPYTVPEGKRLVIEYASMKVTLSEGQSAILGILTTLNGELVTHYFPQTQPALAPNPGISPSGNYVSAGQQVRIYADSGTNVSFQVDRTSNTGTFVIIVSMSGYLVDMPQ